MTSWPIVTLTQSRQVAMLMGIDRDDLPDPAPDLHDRYAALRRDGSRAEALDYIGHALPRLEAVSWAARILDDESRIVDLPVRDQLALDHVLRWLDDPIEANRRAAHGAAQDAGRYSAERHLATAVFYAGGSIAPVGARPVLAPPEAALRYAIGAVKVAAYRGADPNALLDRALALAERIASEGLAALKRS